MPKATLKLRSDGRYRCKCDGLQFYGSTQREAFAARDAYKKAKEAGLNAESAGLTVAQYAARWLPVSKAGVAAGTYADYARMMNTFLVHFESKPLRSVTPSDIREDFQRLTDKSRSYIRKYTQLVRGLFADAVDDRLIPASPVTRRVEIPRGTAGSHRALDSFERELIVRSIGQHDFSAAAMAMMFAGLRPEEALALNVDTCVDFAVGVIHVSQAVIHENNRPVLKPTKTSAGVRDIPLFAPLRQALIGCHGLLLPGSNGEYMTESAIRRKFASYVILLNRLANGGRFRRWYGSTRDDLDLIAHGGTLPPWRDISLQMYDFRHTFATMLWESNVDIKTAMKWMGHTDETMILKVYAHLTGKRERASELSMASALDLLAGVQPGVQTSVTSAASTVP